MTEPTLRDQLDDLVTDVRVDHTALAATARTEGALLARRRRRDRGVAALAAAAVVGMVGWGVPTLLGSRSAAPSGEASAPDRTAAEEYPAWMPDVWPEEFPDYSFDRFEWPGQMPRSEAERYLHPAEELAEGAADVGLLLSPGNSEATVPPGAPATVRIDSRMASAILLELVDELDKPGLTLDPTAFGGQRGDDAVDDGGVITGSGEATLASGQATFDSPAGHSQLEMLVMRQEEMPSNTECGKAGGEVSCSLDVDDAGRTVLVQRKEIPDEYIAQEINLFDPTERLRLRISTFAPPGHDDVFSVDELQQILLNDVWKLQIPTEYYASGQALPFMWLPGQSEA